MHVSMSAPVEPNHYTGSTLFAFLAKDLGLSLDLFNFLFCQGTAFYCASWYRKQLHISRVSAATRHVCALLVGLVISYILYGEQMYHIVLLTAISYVLQWKLPERVARASVVAFAFCYLAYIHLVRQFFFEITSMIDVSAPTMILVQKITSIAFSIDDGRSEVRASSNRAVRLKEQHRLRELPTVLQYFSYMWHFHGLVAGPFVFCDDYLRIMEGGQTQQVEPVPKPEAAAPASITVTAATSAPATAPADSATPAVSPAASYIDPHNEMAIPKLVILQKLAHSLVFGVLFLKLTDLYPITALQSKDFRAKHTRVYYFAYASIATTIARFKFYHVWTLADAIYNVSNFGYNGLAADGQPRWDLFTNVKPLQFEIATSLRDAIGSWNTGTNSWLRQCVYERVPRKYATLITFGVSAMWHGFYPGYYFTFLTGGMFLSAARVLRRLLRSRFQATHSKRLIYNICTCNLTRVIIVYATVPFLLLDFAPSLQWYLDMFCVFHILALIVLSPLVNRRDQALRDSTSTVSQPRENE